MLWDGPILRKNLICVTYLFTYYGPGNVTTSCDNNDVKLVSGFVTLLGIVFCYVFSRVFSQLSCTVLTPVNNIHSSLLFIDYLLSI